VLGACAASAGINAVAPLNAGDLMKLRLMRQRIAGARYPTLASSLLVEQVADIAIVLALVGWAMATDLLPAAQLVRELGAIGLPSPTGLTLYVIAAATIVASGFAVMVVAGRAAALWQRFAQGLAILRTPVIYLRKVALLQLVDWSLRLAATFFFLKAFHVPATLDNILRLQVAHILVTLVPLVPGSVGVNQAAAAYALSGQASPTALLTFSIGMDIVLTAWTVVLGAAALLLMLGTLHWRRGLAVDDAEPAASG
jgi:uncharacterized membrane protein YbhN (UPF0104 family)